MIVEQQQYKLAVGTFSNYTDAQSALHELRDIGFAMDRVSVVGHDINRNSNLAGAEVSDRFYALEDGNRAEQGAATGAVAGVAVGGLTGLLVGLGMVAIPGVGPIMLAGAAATTLATALTGGAIGAATGTIFGGLVGLGIPEDRARTYSDRVDEGDYLVMVEGLEEDVESAQAIFRHHNINHWDIYNEDRNASANYSAKAVSASLG